MYSIHVLVELNTERLGGRVESESIRWKEHTQTEVSESIMGMHNNQIESKSNLNKTEQKVNQEYDKLFLIVVY